MTKEHIETLAAQVVIFYNALIENGFTKEVADRFTTTYMATCMSIIASAN